MGFNFEVFPFFLSFFFAAFGDGLNNLSKSKCQELGPPYPNEVDHSTHALAFFDNEFQKRFPNGCPHGVEEGYDPKIFFQN